MSTAPTPASPLLSYEALCKIVLSRRTHRIYLLLLTSTSLLLTLSSSLKSPWLIPSFLLFFSRIPFTLSNLGYFFCWFVGSVLPVVVLRKRQLNTTRNPPRTFLALLLSPQALTSFQTHLACASWFAFLYCSFWSSESRGLDWECFYYVYRRRHWVLNESAFTIHFNLISFSLIYSALQSLSSRSTVRWQPHSLSSQRTFPNIKHISHLTFPPTIKLAFLHSILFPLTYLFIRYVSLRLLIALSPALRRTLIHAYQTGPPYTLSLLTKLTLSTFSLALLWELANTLFDVYIARPIYPAAFAAQPHMCLFEGIRGKEGYFQHQAYLELSDLARTSPERTSALFRDMSPDYAAAVSPRMSRKTGLWGPLCREALIHLGQDYARLKRRGRPPPAPVVVASPAPKPPSAPPPKWVHPLHAISSSRAFPPPPKPSATSSLFSSLSTIHIHPPPALETAAKGIVSKADKRLHEIGAVKQVEELGAEAGTVVGRWWAGVRDVVGWGKDRPRGLIERSLPRREMDVWIVESLSHLVASSITLDPYGLAQRSVPSILEAFFLYITELESLMAELRQIQSTKGSVVTVTSAPEYRKWHSYYSQEMPGLVWRWVGWRGLEELEGEAGGRWEDVLPLLTALKEGVAMIVSAYGEMLEAYKFPPTLAEKLKVFIRYM